MNEIQKIISIVQGNNTNEDVLAKMGVLLKTTGRIHVLTPILDGVQNIGLVIDNNKIRSIGIILKESVSFISLINDFPVNYSCLYNHYDEETVVNFPYDDKLTIRAIKEGYIDNEALKNQLFNRFEIEVKG